MKSGITKPNGSEKIPRWSLDNIYTGFGSSGHAKDKKKLTDLISELENFVEDHDTRSTDPYAWLSKCIQSINTIRDLFENLEDFAYCQYSVDTTDQDALKQMNEMDLVAVSLKRGMTRFRNSLSSIKELVPGLSEKNHLIHEYAFFLNEELYHQQHQMSEIEEELAADLSRSGGLAWGRLQEAVSSTLSMPWDTAGDEQKTVIELRALAFHKDRDVREKAFRKELKAWKQVEVPLAYALNGVKGFSSTLNARRHYSSTLERSARQARVSTKSLDALIGAMEKNLELFRTYLRNKAKFLGIKKAAFFDLFAPVGAGVKTWSYKEAGNFIVEQFAKFDKDFGSFAKHAFDNSWVDAEPRQGKVGGAYCISFPIQRESRVFCNFDGSYSSVTTIAHELGHAYHHHILRDESAIHRDYPMTLAETASIFSETLVFNAALESAGTKERITIIESFLQDSTQVIVDILSRFYFEQMVFERRDDGELSPDDFCNLMTEAQKKTYGNALDESNFHPYMWAVKGHYYNQDLAYYNFPYAFGQLFGLGLFSQYKKAGSSFADTYKEILLRTGKASAEDVTAGAGFDIETPGFWEDGIALIGEYSGEFERLIAE
jgi:oligoendopeptidase F